MLEPLLCVTVMAYCGHAASKVLWASIHWTVCTLVWPDRLVFSLKLEEEQVKLAWLMSGSMLLCSYKYGQDFSGTLHTLLLYTTLMYTADALTYCLASVVTKQWPHPPTLQPIIVLLQGVYLNKTNCCSLIEQLKTDIKQYENSLARGKVHSSYYSIIIIHSNHRLRSLPELPQTGCLLISIPIDDGITLFMVFQYWGFKAAPFPMSLIALSNREAYP